MSSSWQLFQRRNAANMGDQWSRLKDPTMPLGGMENYYITDGGGLSRCHPDFDSTPIGKCTGMLLCTRRPKPDRDSVCKSSPDYSVPTPSDDQLRASMRARLGQPSLNLYSLIAPPTQINNPDDYRTRVDALKPQERPNGVRHLGPSSVEYRRLDPYTRRSGVGF